MSLLLNTLYVTQPETHLFKEGETVVVKRNHQKCLQVPLHHLQGIVILGTAYASPELMRACLERNLSLVFLDEHGRFLGRLEGTNAPGAWLRRNQMEAHLDSARSLSLAKLLVKGKLANQRHVLQRAAREATGENAERLNGAAERIQHIAKGVDAAQIHDEARGYEGEAAACYFDVFSCLIRQQTQAFPWQGRSRRPPKDPLNALLSFAYALLLNDCLSACQAVGLDPAFGFLHAFRPGRPALALDLMEVFRPLIADRLVLTLVNNQQVGPSGFRTTESGAVEMDIDTRRQVITTYQQRKAQTLRHPVLDQELPWGLVLQMEARLLARYLRGDLETFPPFHPRG